MYDRKIICFGRISYLFIKKEVRDTNYKNDAILYTYIFTTHHSQNTLWKVKDIRKDSHRNKDYEAWCVEEPETHSFPLEGGIVTGNCLSIPFDKLLAEAFNGQCIQCDDYKKKTDERGD